MIAGLEEISEGTVEIDGDVYTELQLKSLTKILIA